MIRAVIFDIGGVLSTTVPDEPLRRAWEQRLGLARGQLAEIVFTSEVGYQAALGQAAPADVWQYVAGQMGLSPAERDALAADFWHDTTWDDDLLVFVHSLKPRYKLGILSDAWADVRVNVADRINSETFDVIMFSAEEGLLKPDPVLFRRILTRLGVMPAETIFVDDRPRNVDGACALGIHGLLFTDAAAVRVEITHLLAEK